MSDLLAETIASIPHPNEELAQATAQRLDAKTKPRGSLGRLEEVAGRLASIRGEVPNAVLETAIVVAAADHGVAIEGVSAYPREVTAQMLANFGSGGAAVCVLAREAGARLLVVDAGVAVPPGTEIEYSRGIRCEVVDGLRGTGNIAVGPAMSRSTAIGLVERGIALTDELSDERVGLVAIGDVGIANTTAASALCAVLLPADPVLVCGRGTGLDDAGLERKVGVVRRALAVNGLGGGDGDGHGASDPLTALCQVGGSEIAFLVGVILGAAARRMPVVLDGFVTGSAALVASSLAPAVKGSMIAATRSPEPGHALALERLGLEPLLDLGLRLGEGSGAALAIPLLRAAIAILTEMATFDAAGVSRA
ncbi:MAG: nicotinate-nucleotide--dimethylbenzimidazole phosphoribosyltransferase [Actinomycetota bacterium]